METAPPWAPARPDSPAVSVISEPGEPDEPPTERVISPAEPLPVDSPVLSSMAPANPLTTSPVVAAILPDAIEPSAPAGVMKVMSPDWSPSSVVRPDVREMAPPFCPEESPAVRVMSPAKPDDCPTDSDIPPVEDWSLSVTEPVLSAMAPDVRSTSSLEIEISPLTPLVPPAVRRVMSPPCPPTVSLVPVVTDTWPPVPCVVAPAVTETELAVTGVATVAVPPDRVISPVVPVEDAPVSIEMAPELPIPELTPVLTVILPVVGLSSVMIVIVPELVVPDAPDTIITLPPS